MTEKIRATVRLPALDRNRDSFKGALLRQAGRRELLGAIDHPADGRTRLGDVGFTLRDLRLDSQSGDLTASVQFFGPQAAICKSLLVNGAAGISPRMRGTRNSDGTIAVESMQLLGWALVEPGQRPSLLEIIAAEVDRADREEGATRSPP